MSNWDSNYYQGVLTVEKGVVYMHHKTSKGMKAQLYGCTNAVSAQWSGDYIIVTLADGKTRKYKDRNTSSSM